MTDPDEAQIYIDEYQHYQSGPRKCLTPSVDTGNDDNEALPSLVWPSNTWDHPPDKWFRGAGDYGVSDVGTTASASPGAEGMGDEFAGVPADVTSYGGIRLGVPSQYRVLAARALEESPTGSDGAGEYGTPLTDAGNMWASMIPPGDMPEDGTCAGSYPHPPLRLPSTSSPQPLREISKELAALAAMSSNWTPPSYLLNSKLASSLDDGLDGLSNVPTSSLLIGMGQEEPVWGKPKTQMPFAGVLPYSVAAGDPPALKEESPKPEDVLTFDTTDTSLANTGNFTGEFLAGGNQSTAVKDEHETPGVPAEHNLGQDGCCALCGSLGDEGVLKCTVNSCLRSFHPSCVLAAEGHLDGTALGIVYQPTMEYCGLCALLAEFGVESVPVISPTPAEEDFVDDYHSRAVQTAWTAISGSDQNQDPRLSFLLRNYVEHALLTILSPPTIGVIHQDSSVSLSLAGVPVPPVGITAAGGVFEARVQLLLSAGLSLDGFKVGRSINSVKRKQLDHILEVQSRCLDVSMRTSNSDKAHLSTVFLDVHGALRAAEGSSPAPAISWKSASLASAADTLASVVISLPRQSIACAVSSVLLRLLNNGLPMTPIMGSEETVDITPTTAGSAITDDKRRSPRKPRHKRKMSGSFHRASSASSHAVSSPSKPLHDAASTSSVEQAIHHNLPELPEGSYDPFDPPPSEIQTVHKKKGEMVEKIRLHIYSAVDVQNMRATLQASQDDTEKPSDLNSEEPTEAEQLVDETVAVSMHPKWFSLRARGPAEIAGDVLIYEDLPLAQTPLIVQMRESPLYLDRRSQDAHKGNKRQKVVQGNNHDRFEVIASRTRDALQYVADHPMATAPTLFPYEPDLETLLYTVTQLKTGRGRGRGRGRPRKAVSEVVDQFRAKMEREGRLYMAGYNYFSPFLAANPYSYQQLYMGFPPYNTASPPASGNQQQMSSGSGGMTSSLQGPGYSGSPITTGGHESPSTKVNGTGV